MTSLPGPCRIVSSAVALVLLFQISPAMADGSGDGKCQRGVVVTFTKWVTGVAPAPPQDQPATTRYLMRGTVEGDLGPGIFTGEVLDHRLSTPGHVTVPVNALEAVYEVQARESFGALIRGGQSTGRGLLDGRILNRWRTGAPVHVDFRVIPTCDGNPAGPCFRGTIRILPDCNRSEDDDDD